MNKKVSIIVAVYNVEQYIRQCFDSLINQTYKDIEIVVVNDGSPDHSLDIINEYASKDNRIVIINKENGGLASARNAGMEIATGDYIMYVDPDDWVELNACQRLVELMEEQNPDVVMFSYYREYADKTLEKRDIFPKDFIIFDEKQCRQLHRRHAGAIGEELAHPENFDAICSMCTKIYRGDIIREHKEIRYTDNKIIGTYGDGLFNLYYYKYVNKAVFTNECLYHYRKTNATSNTTAYKKEFPKRWGNLFDIISNYISNNNLGEDFKLGLSNRIAISIIGLGLNEMHAPTGFNRKYKEVKKILTEPRYRTSIKEFDTHLMPIHWKAFFFCCRYKLCLSVCGLLSMIKYLKSKI